MNSYAISKFCRLSLIFMGVGPGMFASLWRMRALARESRALDKSVEMLQCSKSNIGSSNPGGLESQVGLELLLVLVRLLQGCCHMLDAPRDRRISFVRSSWLPQAPLFHQRQALLAFFLDGFSRGGSSRVQRIRASLAGSGVCGLPGARCRCRICLSSALAVPICSASLSDTNFLLVPTRPVRSSGNNLACDL